MKRFIALLVVLLLLVTLSTACSGTIHSDKKQEVQEEVAGSYHLYFTEINKKYLSFLENFDETKYEIVNISRGYGAWYVTYKNIEE